MTRKTHGGDDRSLETAEEPTMAPAEASPETPAEAPSFPVVAMGASAGGLDAFKRFFDVMPVNSGMAFVLIPHLDPRRKSLMAELLAKHTAMPVSEVENGMALAPNRVYVIPSDSYLTISGGTLRTAPRPDAKANANAVDIFFRDLSEAWGEMAIGVILSGTGSHGTLGLREIKARGGLTLAQDPTTASQEQMPRSAIASDLVDYVLEVEAMPKVLADYVAHLRSAERENTAESEKDESGQLERIIALLRARYKYDFRCYRRKMLMRRVRRRMSLARIERIADYLNRLRDDPDEVVSLFKDLLIGVTGFFREPESFVELDRLVVEPLMGEAERDGPLRIWIPACSTGEEVYSIAMLFAEACEKLHRPCDLQIFATDIDEDALEYARQGIYPRSIASELSAKRIKRFFVGAGEHHVQIAKPLREMIVFANQNLVSDAPFSRLDLISCRNLLIYMDQEVQRKIIALFHFALKPNGFLFLGPSETVGRHANLFETLSKKWRLFRRVGPTRRDMVHFPVAGVRSGLPMTTAWDSTSRPGFSELTQRRLLEIYAPAAVLVNHRFEILYFHGPTSHYLELPSGEPTLDLFAMIRPGLRTKLRAACHEAVREGCPVKVERARLKREGRYFLVHMRVDPVTERRDGENLLLVTFADQEGSDAQPAEIMEAESAETAAVHQLEQDLKTTREELQSTIEEMESSNEELKASNEEVMSMNEELQSANEELETSKEELQSLNEELTTVNTQLQDKVDELQRINDDITNLLSSTDLAVVFLDTDLRIKRFTPATAKLLTLLEGDVGRSLGDFAPKFDDDSLLADARRVLTELSPQEKAVSDHDGRHYLRRIQPYRTEDNRIDGVVVTFVDITRRRQMEQELRSLNRDLEQRIAERTAELRQREREYRTLADNVPALFCSVDSERRYRYVNRRFAELLGRPPGEVVGQTMEEVLGASLAAQIESKVSTALGGREEYAEVPFERDEERKVFEVSFVPDRDENGRLNGLLMLGYEITRRKLAENALRNSEVRYRSLFMQSPDAVFVNQRDRVALINEAGLRLFGADSPDQLVGRSVFDLFPQDCHPLIRERIRRLREQGEPVPMAEERVLRLDGGEVDVEAHSAAFPLGGETAIHVILRDITRRKRNELALKDREHRLSAIVATAADAIITTDHQGVVRNFNRAAESMFGFSAGEAIGMSMSRLFGPDHRPSQEAFMEQCRQWSLLGAEGIRVAAVGNRRDGSLFPLELSMTQTDHLGLYVGLLRDVSERRALEQEVIEMSSQEQERIGREIHDGIGQQLTALSLFASSLQQNLQRIGREQEANSAKELTTYIQQVLQEAKNLSRGLAPLEIGREELPDILSMLAEQTQRSTEIDCRFDMPEWIGSLGESTALQLYRIAQEAVNNAVKHAKCRRIEIALQREAHHLVLSISDDGIGIDPEIHRIERLGMHIMRYRAGAVGGTLQVVSGAKGGTRIVCRVNLPASESNPEPRPEKQ